ncbi:AraC family transcriptional regulator [Variovorax sp. 770b2]|uniref:AraC family transcriptional regulator n=1 Tax=Variovorax sp. 770b2 TaxID=1566271 RepID=UPI0008F09DDE|nr:AraC family transcriptional regulator [Variovorax sp. 770b2]SFQ02016.1 AraC-type DNA-binding protein [Variovorax sp. 770b2]
MVHCQPPDLESRVYTPQRIIAVVGVLSEDGIAASEALAGSGLDEQALHLQETRVSYRQIATVFRNALRLAPDPAIALRAGTRMHVTAFGIYGYALLSSPTRADAIDFTVKNSRAMGPVTDIGYTQDGVTETYSFEVLLTPDPADALYRFSIEFTFAAHLTVSRDVYGELYGYSAIRVAYPMPAHADAYREVLHCPVQFDQPVNELQLDIAAIHRIPRLPDSVTHAITREMCQQFLRDLVQSDGVASTVRRVLIEQLPWRFPNIDSIARELAMHPRTLRRKLEAESTSYRDLLADVRRGLAIEYLRKTRMSTEEISSRLGYSDAANFRHAFLRWTGKTPHEYRRR